MNAEVGKIRFWYLGGGTCTTMIPWRALDSSECSNDGVKVKALSERCRGDNVLYIDDWVRHFFTAPRRNAPVKRCHAIKVLSLEYNAEFLLFSS